jgi:hypothetical protein
MPSQQGFGQRSCQSLDAGTLFGNIAGAGVDAQDSLPLQAQGFDALEEASRSERTGCELMEEGGREERVSQGIKACRLLVQLPPVSVMQLLLQIWPRMFQTFSQFSVRVSALGIGPPTCSHPTPRQTGICCFWRPGPLLATLHCKPTFLKVSSPLESPIKSPFGS